MNKRKKMINKITKLAILSAISFLLYLLRFPLPIFPSFLDIHFSNLPAILAGMIYGPVGGIVVIVIKGAMKLLVHGTSTAYVGDLADLLIGGSTVLVCSLIYKFNRTKKGGVIALLCGTVTWIGVALLTNGLFLIDFFAEYYGIENLLKTLSSISGVTSQNYKRMYLLYGCLPFNLLLALSTNLITFFVYKRLSIIFQHDFFTKKDKKQKNINVGNETNNTSNQTSSK